VWWGLQPPCPKELGPYNVVLGSIFKTKREIGSVAFFFFFFFNGGEGAQGLNIRPATKSGKSLYLWSFGSSHL